jgi:CheY-like chemotaxis protein
LVAVASRGDALRTLSTGTFPVVIAAISLPDGRWLDFLSDTAPAPAAPNLIVLSPVADPGLEEAVTSLGGSALLAEPLVPEDVRRAVEAAARDWIARGERPPVKQGASAGVGPRMPTVPRILVVDDEPVILELTARILRPQGIEVRTAESGYEAVDVLEHDADISFAILDWHLPGMTGEHVFDRLAAIRPGIHAIVISADPTDDVQRAFYGRKVDRFLAKPFRPETLVTAVRTAMAA